MAESSTMSDFRKMSSKEYFLIASFCFMNIVNYMDRVGIASVLVKVQKHFILNDSYGGLLQTTLLIALTLSAPVFGYCGDRLSRKWIIIGCILTWSLSTLVGVLSGNFWILLLSRAIVGIGQSGFTTISPTVISDVALGGARSIFLACFYLGIPIGCGLGYMVAVSVTGLTGSWKYGLCVGPMLCVIGIVLLCFITFPKRGEKETFTDSTVKTTFLKDLQYLMGTRSFLTITASFTCVCFTSGAMTWWMPKCLFYGFQLLSSNGSDNFQEASFYFGLLAILTGFFGVLTGLCLSRCLRDRFPRCDPIICGVGLLIASPFAAGALVLIPKSKLYSFILIFVCMLNVNLNWAVVTDILLYIVKPSRRTSAQGVNMFFSHSFGDCISPYIIGFLSDYIKNNYHFNKMSSSNIGKKDNEIGSVNNAKEFYALQWSLFLTVIILIFGAIFFFVTSVFILRDIKRAKESISEQSER